MSSLKKVCKGQLLLIFSYQIKKIQIISANPENSISIIASGNYMVKALR